MRYGLWYKYVVGGVVLVLFKYVICSHKCFGLLYDLLYVFCVVVKVRYTNSSSHMLCDTANFPYIIPGVLF